MAKLISAAMGIASDALTGQGAFDGFVDIDSRLYVDPHLLDACPEAELANSRARFERYFRDVITILRQSQRRDDLFWRQARQRLIFHEMRGVPLGYSKGHTAGSAIGPKLALDLTILAKEIVDAGVRDPEIFELVGLLQEGVGADRVSDMTVRIILPDLLAYSARIARVLGVRTTVVRLGENEHHVPAQEQAQPVILVPASLLRDLPVAHDWDDIDRVSSHNAALRNRVNPIIGGTWKKATSRRVPKADLRQTLLRHPELIRELVDKYRQKPREAYDFRRDPAAQKLWHDVSLSLAAEQPLDLHAFQALRAGDSVQVVRTICEKFKRLVEDNRYSRVLYNDDGSPRKEAVAQLAFYAIAEAYCQANNLDLSPEVDSGGGPVDFKMSRGHADRVLVEVKLSSNSNLRHGFEVQLPTYARAERSRHDILLIVRTTPSETAINRVRRLAAEARNQGQRVPEIIVVDGRLMPAASRR